MVMRVSRPGDAHEREADRIANAVASQSGIGDLTQAAAGQGPRRCGGDGAAMADAAPGVATALGSPGRPLDRETRGLMESRIGFDFSKVRVHTDPKAAASARSLGARAYTIGNDVVFAAGRFTPRTTDGRRLLAHELTHVVQQSPAGAPSRAPASFPISRSGERMLARDPDPNAPAGPGPKQTRIVRLDNNVFAEIGRGNAQVAGALRAMTQDPNTKVQMSRGVYIETTRVTGEMLAVRKALIEKLHIEIVDEPLAARAETYGNYADAKDFPTHGGPKVTGGEKATLEDLPHIASAKAGGPDVELWSMDGRVQGNAAKLGVKIAPESKIPILKNVPDSAGKVIQLFPEIKPPSGGGPTGAGGGGGKGGPPSPPEQGGGGPAGGGTAKASAAPSIGSIPEGTSIVPESKSDTVARSRAVAQLEQETAESVRLSGRVQAYAAVFGAAMQIYTALSTVADAQTMLADGTLFGDAQRKSEAVEKRSASDLSDVESMLNDMSLLDMVAQVSNALTRRDDPTLFDLSDSVGKLGSSLQALQDRYGAMATQLERRAAALEVMKNYFRKMVELPVDPLAGTIPQAQAFEMYQSVEKFQGPVSSAALNYRKAADQLSFYANYLASLAHEANKAAWVLILRRVKQQAEAAEKARQSANPPPTKPAADQSNAHPTPPGVHFPPIGFPSIEEQKGKEPCPNCHTQVNEQRPWMKDDPLFKFKPMSDEDLAKFFGDKK